MKSLFLVGLYSFLSFSVGDDSSVVYTPTSEIVGTVKVDFDRNQITVKSGNEYMSLTARNFTKVVLNGGEEVFYSSPFGLNSKWFLFKTLVDGKTPLLYKEGIRMSQFDNSTFPPYFMMVEGSVYSLESKKQVFDVYREHKDLVKEYIRDSGIDFSNKDDLATLFKFLHTL